MKNRINLTDHTVAVYMNHDDAEGAIKILASTGFDMRHLSIIGRNYATAEHPVGFVNTGDRMLAWGKLGAFWGSIWGALFGSAMLVIPGMGFVMVAGWLTAVIQGAVVGGGIAAIGAAFASIGIPRDSVVRYETDIRAGQFIVLAHGTPAESLAAQASLLDTPAIRLNTYADRRDAVSVL